MRIRDNAKCILSHVSVCLSVPRRIPTLLHGHGDPDVTWRNGRGCPLLVYYWTDLQSVHGFCCYDNIALNATCRRVLVLALCLVIIIIHFKNCHQTRFHINFYFAELLAMHKILGVTAMPELTFYETDCCNINWWQSQLYQYLICHSQAIYKKLLQLHPTENCENLCQILRSSLLNFAIRHCRNMLNFSGKFLLSVCCTVVFSWFVHWYYYTNMYNWRVQTSPVVNVRPIF